MKKIKVPPASDTSTDSALVWQALKTFELAVETVLREVLLAKPEHYKPGFTPAEVVSATLGMNADEFEQRMAKSAQVVQASIATGTSTPTRQTSAGTTIAQAENLWVDKLKLSHPDLEPYVIVDDQQKLWRANEEKEMKKEGRTKRRELHELRPGEKRMIINILNDIFRGRNPVAAMRGTITESYAQGPQGISQTRKEVELAEVFERAGVMNEKILLVRVEDDVVTNSGGYSINVDTEHEDSEPLYGYLVIGINEKTLAHPRRGGIEPYELTFPYQDPAKNQVVKVKAKLDEGLWWVFVHEVFHAAYPIYNKEYRGGPSPDDDLWTFLYEWTMGSCNILGVSNPTILREITGYKEIEITRADGSIETISKPEYGDITGAILSAKEVPRLRRLFKSYRIRYDLATGGIRLAN